MVNVKTAAEWGVLAVIAVAVMLAWAMQAPQQRK